MLSIFFDIPHKTQRYYGMLSTNKHKYTGVCYCWANHSTITCLKYHLTKQSKYAMIMGLSQHRFFSPKIVLDKPLDLCYTVHVW